MDADYIAFHRMRAKYFALAAARPTVETVIESGDMPLATISILAKKRGVLSFFCGLGHNIQLVVPRFRAKYEEDEAMSKDPTLTSPSGVTRVPCRLLSVDMDMTSVKLARTLQEDAKTPLDDPALGPSEWMKERILRVVTGPKILNTSEYPFAHFTPIPNRDTDEYEVNTVFRGMLHLHGHDGTIVCNRNQTPSTAAIMHLRDQLNEAGATNLSRVRLVGDQAPVEWFRCRFGTSSFGIPYYREFAGLLQSDVHVVVEMSMPRGRDLVSSVNMMRKMARVVADSDDGRPAAASGPPPQQRRKSG